MHKSLTSALQSAACAVLGAVINGCSAGCSNDGHTQCKDTVDAKGYQCVCGDGYISRDNGDGSTSCLQINQCLSREAQEDPQCNCERCACQEKAGGYE